MHAMPASLPFDKLAIEQHHITTQLLLDLDMDACLFLVIHAQALGDVCKISM